MATRAELDKLRRALNRVTGAARADLRALLATVDPDDRRSLQRALGTAYPLLLTEYGTATAALGADMVETWADELRIRPTVALAPTLAPEEAVAVAAWSLKQANWQASLSAMTDQLVKQPYRRTVQGSAHASGVAWARVPTGATTCAFCVMAASRGAVYKTSGTAGADHKYHGDCDCQVVMVRDPGDYPEGYDPAAYYEVYAAGWSNAKDAGSTKTKDVLAAMRQIADLH